MHEGKLNYHRFTCWWCGWLRLACAV